jgi:hypothetical protein
LEEEEEGKGKSYLHMEEGRWLLSRSGGGYTPGERSRPHLAGKDAAVHAQATEGEEFS